VSVQCYRAILCCNK